MPKGYISKLLLIMKLTGVIVLMALMQVSAATFGQNLTLKEDNVSISKIFWEIRKQTGYNVLMKSNKLNTTQRINVSFENTPVTVVLDQVIKGTDLEYAFDKKVILITQKEKSFFERMVERFQQIDVTGKVVGEDGAALAGATIRVKGTTKTATANQDGSFLLTGVEEGAILEISFIGYKTKEIKAEKNVGTIKMVEGKSELDEVTINAGYYTTTDKLRTGSISKVDGKEIEKQPVTSLLMALQGRVPGLDVSPLNGVAGSAVRVEIRGRNSVRWDGSYPLYVIDGLPIDSKEIQSSNYTALNGNGFDPLSTINPANIESIEILKDADATSIYGSRGANGVILITTKKGSSNGKTNFEISSYAGKGNVSNFLKLLNTQQYLQMRREAFKNAGATPQSWDGYDLLQWDTTRYTDWQKELFGNSANFHDLQANVSGGNKNTSFRLGISHHKEGMVFPGDFGFIRTTGHFNLNHTSINDKFKALLTTNFGLESNKIFNGLNPVAAALQLAPNAPKIYNQDGTLNWENSTWTNPYSGLKQTDQSRGNNLLVSTSLSYELIPRLFLKSNFGYQLLNRNGINKIPFSSMNPAWLGPNSTTQSNFETNARSSWNIEPQISYSHEFSRHRLDVLVGSSWQRLKNAHQLITGAGYTSDVLLGSLRGATAANFGDDSNVDYRYMSFFGRVGYSLRDKYLLNLTGRRDGSSRFGPNNRYATFGAIGGAWIFSKEVFLENQQVLSFGKLRASYGTSGNDQIGDYKYLSTYGYTSGVYDSTLGLSPRGLFNADYAWELTKKLEFAIEMGFFKDKFSLMASWYRNRSSNQLLNYPLPSTSGFSTVLANLDALVQNTGFEFSLQTINVSKGNFRWSTSFNASIPRNKLVEFKDIEKSSYNATLTVGKSINILKSYNSLGVNPQTGLYDVQDVNGDGILNNTDRIRDVITDRTYFGGISNSMSYRGIELSFLFQFSKQLKPFAVLLAGQANQNVPLEIFENRWKTPGDIATYQKVTTGSDVYTPINNFVGSNGPYEDASFLRLKTLTLSYQLPSKWVDQLKCSMLRIYMQGQNLFTYTKSNMLLDPETNNGLPPLRVLTAGIEIKF